MLAAGFLLPLPAQALDVPAQLSTLDIVFYTFTLTCIVFFSGMMVLLRAYTWLTYTLYGFLAVALIAALDGTLAYLFDGDVWWMGYAPLLIGAVTVGYGYLHIAYRIDSAHWLARTRSMFVVYGVLGLLLLPGYFLLPSMVPLYATLNTLMLLMFAGQALPPVTWRSLSRTQHRVAIIWPVLTATIAISIYGVHFAGSGLSRQLLDSVNRGVLFLHLAHMFVFVGFVVSDELRQRRQAQQDAQLAARKAAEAALALERSERDYERARRVVADRTQRLATASHDLKQPIAALRQTISQMQDKDQNPQSQRIMDAIDYLDQLAGTYLDLGNHELDNHDQELARDATGKESVPIGLILETVASMFNQEAQAVGCEINIKHDDQHIHVVPLALTRALSNLLGNALAHSGGQRIDITAKRESDLMHIEISDNGCGMPAHWEDELLELRAKGVDSSGSGLGLPIVRALAEQYKWQLNIRSEPESGTQVRLTIPLE